MGRDAAPRCTRFQATGSGSGGEPLHGAPVDQCIQRCTVGEIDRSVDNPQRHGGDIVSRHGRTPSKHEWSCPQNTKRAREKCVDAAPRSAPQTPFRNAAARDGSDRGCPSVRSLPHECLQLRAAPARGACMQYCNRISGAASSSTGDGDSARRRSEPPRT